MGKIMDLSFYKGKTVFITGHTGFKGSWMCKVLTILGANVVGYALEPESDPNLFSISGIASLITSIYGDIRDSDKIKNTIKKHKPDVAIHMAAQPLVRSSYENPAYTYEVNVMGTVNFLESVRQYPVKSVINVTTDKVYQNNEWEWGYREIDRLDGHDPYSNSKSCSELVTSSYKKSFFSSMDIGVSTCRAGNVIGGGDFAKDRIVPDCVRSALSKDVIIVRNPYSIRPYQHVLEPVCAYLLLAARQYEDGSLQGSYNVGPEDKDCVATGLLVDLFCRSWGEEISWINAPHENAPHEANFLKLDCSKIKSMLGWKARWGISDAVDQTVEWSKAWLDRKDMGKLMESQVRGYLS